MIEYLSLNSHRFRIIMLRSNYRALSHRRRNVSTSLGRPTYMSADLCFTTDSFLLLSSFFFRQLPEELAEPYPATWSEVSANWKCMSEMWDIHSPANWEHKTTFFRRFRNLRANLTAYIFGMKHDIHEPVSALQTTRGLLHRLKTTWNLAHKRLQIGGEFSRTLSKFCIPLHCQASQTEISKRNSTKLCQTVDGRSR